jgi:hypothetical protein
MRLPPPAYASEGHQYRDRMHLGGPYTLAQGIRRLLISIKGQALRRDLGKLLPS